MTAADSALSSPGQIAANLPGILGFYPHDSLVIVTFTATDRRECFELGPVLRMDLADMRALPEMARVVDDTCPDMVLGFLVTQREHAEINDIIDTLGAATSGGLLDLDLVWVTPQILTGEPLTIGFAGSRDMLPGLTGEWRHDTVAPVVAARSMAPLVARGELPDLSRRECHEYFRHGTPHHTDADCAQLTAFARERARDLCPSVYPALAADARLLLEESCDLPLTELLADEEVLLTTATLLGTLELRDLIIEDLLADPEVGARLTLAVARTFTGFIRHNALCIHALCMVGLDLPMRATHALLVALEEDPTHMLSRLLLTPAQAGEFDFMVLSAREGSRIVRAGHGIDEPPRGAAGWAA